MSRRKMPNNGWLAAAPTEHTKLVIDLKTFHPSKKQFILLQ